MSGRKYATRNPKAFKESYAEAERTLTTKGRREDGMVQLKPTAIKFRTELFQMRKLNYGIHDVDPEWVKKHQKRIEIVGELDPPVVVKIGREWVCVDGHHRIEAYKRMNGHEQIRCSWFGGTLMEAVEEALSLNSKDRYNLTQKDRLENAWKLVLLGKHSKAVTAMKAGVSERTVGTMRELKKLYDDKHKAESKLFRKRLGAALDEVSWGFARMAFAGVTPTERGAEQEAETLARTINSRLTNKLHKDPAITARALELYRPELPNRLMEEWTKRPPGTGPIAEAVGDEDDEFGDVKGLWGTDEPGDL